MGQNHSGKETRKKSIHDALKLILGIVIKSWAIVIDTGWQRWKEKLGVNGL